MNTNITIEVSINAPIEKIWECFTAPEHITKWCQASDDWCAPSATNDLTVGGKFNTRMESRDGKFGFDFNGVYTDVVPHTHIAYTIEGGRKVEIAFQKSEGGYKVIETFEPETENPLDMQKAGWQSILNNFKKYTESL